MTFLSMIPRNTTRRVKARLSPRVGGDKPRSATVVLWECFARNVTLPILESQASTYSGGGLGTEPDISVILGQPGLCLVNAEYI